MSNNKLSSAPRAKCRYCGSTLQFDGYLRNPKGVCIVLNPDYSIHSCSDPSMTSIVLEQKTVRHLNNIVNKLGSGMKHYRIKLVVEELTPIPQPEIREQFVMPSSDKRPEELTAEQRLLLLTRI